MRHNWIMLNVYTAPPGCASSASNAQLAATLEYEASSTATLSSAMTRRKSLLRIAPRRRRYNKLRSLKAANFRKPVYHVASFLISHLTSRISHLTQTHFIGSRVGTRWLQAIWGVNGLCSCLLLTVRGVVAVAHVALQVPRDAARAVAALLENLISHDELPRLCRVELDVIRIVRRRRRLVPVV